MGSLPIALQRFNANHSRRKVVGVTPINFRNTRFSWDASLNPTASATSAIDRSRFDNSSFATLTRIAGKPTSATSGQSAYRQILVVQHQLTQQLDLLDLIVRRRRKPFDRLRLSAVNLGLDLRNFLQHLRREI